jgi:hypothetical protein
VLRQNDRRSPLAIRCLVLVAALAGACDKSDQLRSALEVDQAGWNQQISALKARANDLEQRFKALPPEPKGTPLAVTAQRRRVEAAVMGARQSLFDLERTVADGVRDVEDAIARGDLEGEQALTAAVERLGGYVHQQQQNVEAAEAALLHVGEVR